MIRILQVVTHMDRGGLETMLMNYYRHIDYSKLQFDFLLHRKEQESSQCALLLHGDGNDLLIGKFDAFVFVFFIKGFQWSRVLSLILCM